MDKLYRTLTSNATTVWDFYRNDIEDYSLSGFPVMFNEDIIILNYVYDFILDGYKVIRTKDISKYDYSSDKCQHINYIYTQEKIKPKMPEGIKNFETIEGLLSQLRQLDTVCSIECELSKSTFHIGKICSIKDKFIEMICFDPVCNLYNELAYINIDEITTISFGNRYSIIMEKYVNWN